MSISKILRKDRENHAGAPIVIQIIVNRKAVCRQTGERVPPQYWDELSQCISPRYPNAKLINAKIDRMVAEIKEKLLKVELSDKAVTTEVVKGQFKAPHADIGFYEYCTLQVEKWKGRKKESTRSKYIHELSKIRRYAPNLTFSDVTGDWLAEYEKYQREKLGNNNNTISRSFRNLKTYYLAAIADGLATENPFKKHPGPRYKNPKRHHLTGAEIDKITELLKARSVRGSDYVAGWFFVFSSLTGLRWSDCQQFDPDKHIVEGKRILLNMVKTEESVSILITKKIQTVLGAMAPLFGEIPTNQECNRAVKEICKLAEIKKPVTFHCARHSFGFSCAEANVPIEITAKLMGHSDTKTTAVYYHISNDNVDQWMMRLHGGQGKRVPKIAK